MIYFLNLISKYGRIGSIGGRTEKLAVKNAMTAVMGRIGTQFNWFGKGKLRKEAFGSTITAKLIYSKFFIYSFDHI